MAFCRSCGAAMAPWDQVCYKCGVKAGEVDEVAVFKKSQLEKLERYRELLAETEELKTMIKPQSEFPMYEQANYKKRSLMKFFWPYMVSGIGLFILIYVVTIIIEVNSVMDHAYSMSSYEATRYVENMQESFLTAYVIGALLGLAIIIVGIKISKRKRNDFNANADYMNMQQAEKYRKGQDNQKLIDLYQQDINEMYKYEQIVPQEYRTVASVSKIIDLFNEDKANTVDEACAILSGKTPAGASASDSDSSSEAAPAPAPAPGPGPAPKPIWANPNRFGGSM